MVARWTSRLQLPPRLPLPPRRMRMHKQAREGGSRPERPAPRPCRPARCWLNAALGGWACTPCHSNALQSDPLPLTDVRARVLVYRTVRMTHLLHEEHKMDFPHAAHCLLHGLQRHLRLAVDGRRPQSRGCACSQRIGWRGVGGAPSHAHACCLSSYPPPYLRDGKAASAPALAPAGRHHPASPPTGQERTPTEHPRPLGPRPPASPAPPHRTGTRTPRS